MVKEDKQAIPSWVEDRETPPGLVLVRVIVTKTGKVIRSFVPKRKKR